MVTCAPQNGHENWRENRRENRRETSAEETVEGRLHVVAFGAAARARLSTVIGSAQRHDRLAPLTVIVPSALAGSTLKRALARESGGLLAVGFDSLPGLAARLATPRLASQELPPLDALTAHAIVSGLLAGEPGSFGELARHPGTVAPVADTLAELRSLDSSELDALAAASRRGAELVRLHRRYARATASWSDEAHRLATATEAVEAADAAALEIGHAVLYLPRRIGRTELALLAALAARSALTALVGSTGRAGADSVAAEMIEDLVSIGLVHDPLPDLLPAPEIEHSGTTVVCAPDPAEEVRHAVRIARNAIAGGTLPERIAIVSRVREPYSLLAHEELAAAGLAHSAPSPMRLSQSIAGRTLLGLLAWVPGGARRSELMRILRAAPLRDGNGRHAKPDLWDRVAREAGVVAGLDQWRSRLAAARAERERRLEQRGEDPADDGRLAGIDGLLGFVEHLAALLDPGERKGWRPLAGWARAVLESSLGSGAVAESWPTEEKSSHTEVLDLLEHLADLPETGPAPNAEQFLRVLDHELQRSTGRVGRFGAGISVGRLVDAVGADLDLIVVVGAAEGVFPPRRADDAILPARHRRAVGALRLRGSSREEEERDFYAAICSAPTRVLTYPAAEPRSQHEQYPAPWLSALGGARLELASFEAWLGEGGQPATPTERDVAELLVAHRGGAPIDDLAAVTAAGIGRGLASARSRSFGGFDEWSGIVGPHPLLSGELAEHRSPTGLESWAICPFRYYLDKVLGVRPLEDPGTVETITGRDRGSLVHEVLERFFSSRLGTAPLSGWEESARAELLDIADEVEQRYRAQGRTGRRLLWSAEWRALRRHLVAVIEHGLAAPELAGLVPVAVEHAFGHEGDSFPPVQVDAGGGAPLRFGGRVDRVDATPDRRRVVVLDYKTAPGADYRAISTDPVDRGRRLQLPIYALAARELVPEAESVAAYYWFVSPRAQIELLGGEFDSSAEERFHEALGTIVGGIEQGLFPARPGADAWLPTVGDTYEACRFCDYDRVCPNGRADRWQRVRVHGRLERYVRLAEDDQ